MTGATAHGLDVPSSAAWAVADAELEPLREEARALLEDEPPDAERLWELSERWQPDLALWRAACAARFGTALGERGRLPELGALGEACARFAGALPLVGSALAAVALDAGERGADQLDRVRAGTPAALAWGGPADPLELTADGDGEGRVLVSGTVPFVLDGTAGEVVVAAARGREGPVLCVIDDPDAVRASTRKVIDPTRAFAALAFERAPASVLAEAEDAERVLAAAAATGAVLLALDAVGAAQAALELAVSYAREREQFGRPIASFQAVAHHCANMLVLVESARSLARHAAWAVAEGSEGAELAVAEAKAYATEAGCEVGRLAIQVHGGIGMTWARPAHLHYKRCWTARAALGDPSWHRRRVADALASAPSPGLRPMYHTAF